MPKSFGLTEEQVDGMYQSHVERIKKMNENKITLVLDMNEAELIRYSLADFLCWMDGYKAGGGEINFQGSILRLDDFHEKIKRTITDHLNSSKTKD